MRVVTSKQMKQIEEKSLEYDLTFARLMENAGSAAAAFIRRTFRVEGRNCMIFCGKGNNGGDGFVVARKLYENGANVVIVLVEGQPLSEESVNMLGMAEMMELPVFDFAADRAKVLSCVPQADILVDALYGTGFRGELEGDGKEACAMMGEAIAAVVSLDIPSGVECDTGRVAEGAIRADFTVTFDSMKPLHILPGSQPACGQVEVMDIGIPDEARAGLDIKIGDLTTDMAFSWLPKRAEDAHKGDFGLLLAICGSDRYRGAAALSVAGALRTGVGICCLASTGEVCAAVAAKLWEPIFLPLPASEGGSIGLAGAKELLQKELEQATAVLIGCGLGDGPDTLELVRFVLKTAKTPVIIDADGINALAGNIHVLQEAGAPVVLTPHPGEMARLLGCSAQEVQADRYGTAMKAAAEWKAIVVLKGRHTVIATPDGGLLVNKTGNPGLAKGGSGDILAGMTGSFAAQGIPPERAAALAVHLHGLAADHTALRKSQCAMLPSELLEDLPQIFLSHQR